MTSHQIQLIFVDVALITCLAWGLGRLAARIRQPPVIGEILAGILLGPTLLRGSAAQALFPAAVRPLLTGLADIGVALFMFVIGLELNVREVRHRGTSVLAAALGSTLVPFVAGTALAATVLHGHATGNGTAFVVFVGLSLSVTAFPVLARILTDRGLAGTALGGIALGSAAVVDVVAWAGLAVLQMAAAGGKDLAVLFFAPYVLFMVIFVKPLVRRLSTLSRGAGTALTVTGLLLSAAATEAMGMHFIFGAFLFGVVMPRRAAPDPHAIGDGVGRIADLLMPSYFVVAGMNVDLGHLGPGAALALAAIVAAAVLGKFGGGYLGARLQGLPPRPAAGLAALLNTRGLTELIILGVGLQLGLLDKPLYSMMVVMALLTTAMTGPLLQFVYAKPVVVAPIPDPAPEPELTTPRSGG